MTGKLINSERLISFGSPLLIVLLWEISARAGWIDVRFFPAPSSIYYKFVELLQSGEVIRHTLVTCRRLFYGFIVGGIPALLLGIIAGLYRPVYLVFNPLVSATYPIPKSAIYPLILLLLGLGEASKVAMVAMGVFYPVFMNAESGVGNIQRIYLDVGQNYRANRWQIIRTIALPGALPAILAGVKLGLGLGLILISIAEMIGSNDGIGFMIWDAWQTLSVETMFVGLVIVAIIGFLLSLLADELERALVPWKERR